MCESVWACVLSLPPPPSRTTASSGGVGDGFVFLEAGPLPRGVVHFEDRVHQHGGAAGAVGLGQHLCVLAQLYLNDVPLLRARVLCESGGREDIQGSSERCAEGCAGGCM